MKGRFDVDLKSLFFSLLVSQIQKPRQEKNNEKTKFQYLEIEKTVTEAYIKLVQSKHSF